MRVRPPTDPGAQPQRHEPQRVPFHWIDVACTVVRCAAAGLVLVHACGLLLPYALGGSW